MRAQISQNQGKLDLNAINTLPNEPDQTDPHLTRMLNLRANPDPFFRIQTVWSFDEKKASLGVRSPCL